MGRVIGIQGNCKGRGSWDGIIAMTGTSKGCCPSRDVVILCGRKDKVYHQWVWFLWEWGNRSMGKIGRRVRTKGVVLGTG